MKTAGFQICLWLLPPLFIGCRSAHPPPPPPPLLAQANQAAQTATRQAQLGHWAAAADRWLQAADQYALLNRQDLEAIARHNLAQALRHLNQPQHARQQLDQAASINQSAGFEAQWWRNQIALLQLESSLADTNALASRFHELIPQMGQIRDPGTHGLFLNELGLWEWRAGRTDAALDALGKAEKLLSQAGDAAGTATALANRALVLETLSDWPAAWEQWRSVLSRFEALGNPMGIATALAGQGRILVQQQRDPAQAEDLLRRASRSFEQLHDETALAQTRLWLEKATQLKQR